jgi:TetR/AcrR family transcriptional repressor of mexJK operon
LATADQSVRESKPRYRVGSGNRRGLEARSRLDLLLTTARRLFIKHGYEATSLNEVVAIAGGSKATLLKYFGNKAGLFSAVVSEVSSRFVAAAHLADLKGSPEQVLQVFGVRVLQFYLDSESLVAYRGVIAGGTRDRSMARAFYRLGHLTVAGTLAAQLALWHRAGLVVSADSRDDADLFLHLIRAGVYEQRLLGICDVPAKSEIAARVARAVHIFLRGVAADSGGDAGRIVA